MRTPAQWWRDRQWRKTQRAREVWVHLLDPDGGVVATRPATLVPTTQGTFANEGDLVFRPDIGPCEVASLRYVFADGQEATVSLHHPVTHSLDDVMREFGIDEDES